MNHKLKYLSTVFCLILLTATACTRNSTGSGNAGVSLPGSGGNSGSNSGGGSTTAAISENDKPLDVMTKAMRAQLDAKSYRAHVTSTLADTAPNKMVIEYVAPDRYRMVRDGQGGSGEENGRMEFVVIGDAMYIRKPDGGWARAPVNAGEMIKSFRDPKMLDELVKTADVKFVGADTLDGAPMLIYQYTQNNPMGMNLKSTSKTWLSVADGMPRKTETEGVLDGKKTNTVITISDYNADIKIESPAK
jgi:outer membrane lipoprotein-sorting protein